MRIVACGNFAVGSGTESTFSATPDVTCLRVLLRFAAYLKGDHRVKVSSTDVSTAFLNAPLVSDHGIAITPPGILGKMGLVRAGELWVLEKALYGLKESPRAWSLERDRIFKGVEIIMIEGRDFIWLEQCKTEPGAWRIMQGTKHHRVAGTKQEGQWDFKTRDPGEGE